MARRIPAARPDGYSTSEGELEEEPDEWAREEIPEPDAAGDDSEGSEVEGYMLDFGALRDELGKKEEEAAAGGSCFVRRCSTGARGNACEAPPRLALAVAAGFLFASNPCAKWHFNSIP